MKATWVSILGTPTAACIYCLGTDMEPLEQLPLHYTPHCAVSSCLGRVTSRKMVSASARHMKPCPNFSPDALSCEATALIGPPKQNPGLERLSGIEKPSQRRDWPPLMPLTLLSGFQNDTTHTGGQSQCSHMHGMALRGKTGHLRLENSRK